MAHEAALFARGLSDVGFLTTNGKCAVLVNLITSTANIANARTLAKQFAQNLSAL